MQSFKFLFSLILSEMILQDSDKRRQILQLPKPSSVEGHGVVMLTVKTLKACGQITTLTSSGRRLIRRGTSWMLTNRS